ncbi:hypothetical protein [Gluconobacter roseus]|uniref:hypothetical protein n=1 Tax=Gluconobacter roseus TaxID=586239 RepID=UPI00114209B8|nr:hypothetical protein [Gluconobacter roseus]
MTSEIVACPMPKLSEFCLVLLRSTSVLPSHKGRKTIQLPETEIRTIFLITGSYITLYILITFSFHEGIRYEYLSFCFLSMSYCFADICYTIHPKRMKSIERGWGVMILDLMNEISSMLGAAQTAHALIFYASVLICSRNRKRVRIIENVGD